MNKNGIIAVVVVITGLVLVGLWTMRSGQSRPGGGQFDCSAPPGAPSGFTSTQDGRVVTGTWRAPEGGERPTTYVIEAGSSAGANNQGTFTVPGHETRYSREIPAGTYYVRVLARNACGLSAASNELQIEMP